MSNRRFIEKRSKLAEAIHEGIYWAVNDIIVEYQDKFGIEDGDIDPWVEVEADKYLDSATDAMTNYVEQILMSQALDYGNNVVFK